MLCFKLEESVARVTAPQVPRSYFESVCVCVWGGGGGGQGLTSDSK